MTEAVTVKTPTIYKVSVIDVFAGDDVHQRLAMALITKQRPAVTDKILNECENMECDLCARLCCDHGDPMHFHHDGCPSCAGHAVPFSMEMEGKL